MRNPNSFGSISKLSGKRRRPYIVRKTIGFDENGVQQYKILGYFAKRAEALEFLVLYNKDSQYMNLDITLEEVWKALSEEKFISQGQSIPNTYISPYKSLQKLYKLPFARIKLKDYDEIMQTLPTPVTKRNFKIFLNQMYKYAMKHDIVEKNIASNLDTPPIPKSTLHKELTEDEMKLLWNQSDNPVARYWLIYCYTGLRPAELVLIENKNVHLEEKYMIGGIKTEAGTNRPIPLADCILPFIKELYNPENEFLMTIDGEVYNYGKIKHLMDGFCKENNLKHTPHDGRHTCATMLHVADVPLVTIKQILGHAGIEGDITTNVYIHKNLSKLLQAVNSLPVYSS